MTRRTKYFLMQRAAAGRYYTTKGRAFWLADLDARPGEFDPRKPSTRRRARRVVEDTRQSEQDATDTFHPSSGGIKSDVISR